MRVNRNKGFTLVEMLAVLAIISTIMIIAIPSITSSVRRTKKSQDEKQIKLLKSYANQYVYDHRNSVTDECYITIEMLKENGYIKNNEDEFFNHDPIYFRYDKNSNTVYVESFSRDIQLESPSGDACQ